MSLSEGTTAHERVIYHQDDAYGLRATIAIYSAALRPVLESTRFYPYSNEHAGVDNELDLSRGTRAIAETSEIFHTSRTALDYADVHRIAPREGADRLAERAGASR